MEILALSLQVVSLFTTMKDTKSTYSVYLIKLGETVMYVGKTNDFERRKREHLNKIGTTYSAIPVGLDSSEITITKVKDFSNRDESLNFEDELILQYDTINNGWNKNRSGHISTGDRSAIKKRWEEEHEAERKAYKKKWREEHREEAKARSKKWYEEHKEEQRAYYQEYHKKRKLNKAKEEQN